jgi:hypothetical protein
MVGILRFLFPNGQECLGIFGKYNPIEMVCLIKDVMASLANKHEIILGQ